ARERPKSSRRQADSLLCVAAVRTTPLPTGIRDTDAGLSRSLRPPPTSLPRRPAVRAGRSRAGAFVTADFVTNVPESAVRDPPRDDDGGYGDRPNPVAHLPALRGGLRARDHPRRRGPRALGARRQERPVQQGLPLPQGRQPRP